MAALLAAEQPCVALLDVVMPRVDGLELRRSIAEHERLASVPVIACTAHRDLTVVGDVSGFVAVLRKPFTEAQLLSAVERALREARLP